MQIKKILTTVFLAGFICACGQNYKEGANPPPIPQPPQKGMPAAHPPITGGNAETGATGVLMASGKIDIAPELLQRVPAEGVLYIIARPAPSGGPPLAIQRLALPKFPFEYRLMQSDSGMMTGEELKVEDLDALYLVAKIDLDGNVGEVQAGDMEGACAQNPVMPGTEGADIVINVIH